MKRLSTFLALMSSIVVMVGCGTSKPKGITTKFPSWFWQTPLVNGVEVTVGYAPTYHNLESSVNEALEDAARRLWRDRECRIQVVTVSVEVGDEREYIDNVYKLTCSEEGFEDFKKSLVIVDTFSVPELTVLLVATKPLSVEKTLIPSPVKDISTPISVNRFRNVGYAMLDSQWASSFRKAEEDARISMAKCGSSKFQGIDLSRPLCKISVLISEADERLSGIRTITRSIISDTPYVEIVVQSLSNNSQQEE